VGERIEEHGLHIWFGFYEHAFRMLRDAYAESGLAAGEDWWRVPFEKCDAVSLYGQRDDGAWVSQRITLPRRGGPHRGPATEPTGVPLGRAVARTTRWLATGLRSDLRSVRPTRGTTPGGGADSNVAAAGDVLDKIASELERVASPVTVGADDPRRTRRGAVPVIQPVAATGVAAFEALFDRLRRHTRDLRGELTGREPAERARLWAEVLELVAASLAGIVRDGVLLRGFAAIDEEDLRDWLERHGASPDTVRRSAVLRGLYDLTFAYRSGDKQRPSLAAGRGLQSLLLMMNYQGAFMWRMRAGMGDVVFAPLYLALRRRGVRFEFLSRITRLRLMPGRPVIDGIETLQESTLRPGVQRYEPITRIGDWWCWPAEPDARQLTRADDRHRTLVRGVDFDRVVLAIPVGALPEICGELAEADERFAQMLEGAATVRTKAFQVWLTTAPGALRGEPQAMGLDQPATAHADPFDTYCDMSHLLEVEAHRAQTPPRGLAYFCAVLSDDVAPADAERVVRADAKRYLEREAATIWPAAFRDGTFDWSVVFDPLGRQGPDRLGAQYFRANVAPTDRYVTTPAGSVDSRLDPERSGFENLVLAGDWTHNGIDGGCVEAAVISGERAAEALIARRSETRVSPRPRPPYVHYGALATAPGPLLCERARLYCFFVATDRARVQRLCDRVLKEPTGGALRYRVPRLYPVVLTFGTIAGLRSLHPGHADRASASEPEAAVWVPTIAQRFRAGRYVDDHLAIFMPYIWVDDPIAFASGREVYGFAKTQGWMRPLGDPRASADGAARSEAPDPPEELALDVHGVAEYGADAPLGRRRLITVRRGSARRGDGLPGSPRPAGVEGADLSSLVSHALSELDPASESPLALPPRRSVGRVAPRAAILSELLTQHAVRHVFLKQIRDAEQGDLAALQQVVEARSRVTGGSLRWRRLRGKYELSVASLASHPLQEELGLQAEQTIRLAFVAEFGFRMDPGTVVWGGP
jgi:uncharacterized protein with NAD-binding domain and iron-sulfur cluster